MTPKKIFDIKSVIIYLKSKASNTRYIIYAILIGMTLWNYDWIINYFKEVKYEGVKWNALENDSTLKVMYYLKYEISTKRAFLPYEEIDVKLRLHVPNDIYAHIRNRELCVQYIGASKLSEQYDDNSKESLLNEISGPNVIVSLSETEPMINGFHTFSGKETMMYKKPGQYKFRVLSIGNPQVKYFDRSFDETIDIGNSIDLMNKRTNDLLALIAVVNFLLFIVIEIRGSKKVV